MKNLAGSEPKRKKPLIGPGRRHNEDWNRMVWATFKPFMLVFIVLTLGLYISNLLYYKHKWWTCSQPNNTIHYKMVDECKKVNRGKEILPPVFHNRSVVPLTHHLANIGLFCVTGLLGNYINDYHLSHFSAYALAVIWVYDHYSNYRLILNTESLLYILAHVCHFMAFATAFCFSATIIDNMHRRMEYPKVKKVKVTNLSR